MDKSVLIPNGFIDLPETAALIANLAVADSWSAADWRGVARRVSLATVMSNLAYYGYTLDRNAYVALIVMDDRKIAQWWETVQPVLAELTGDDRKMDRFIVYKNFPKEALDLTHAEQVTHQLLIYFGFPYEVLTEEEVARPPLGEMPKLKVLTLADDATLPTIYANLVRMSNRWSDNQSEWTKKLYVKGTSLDLDAFGFKENGITLIAHMLSSADLHDDAAEIKITTATDVLRLAAALSDADISLRVKPKLRTFKRSERRRLLAILEQCRNIEDDFAARPEMFKRLMEHLRPGDYKFDRVKKAYDDLYNGRLKSFYAKIDPPAPDASVLAIAASRPGEYLRRFHHLYNQYGEAAVDALLPLLGGFTTRQLVNFRAYLRTVNDRTAYIYPPRGRWSRAQVVEKTKRPIEDKVRALIDINIGIVLASRLNETFPEGFSLDSKMGDVRLQTNDQKLAEYGRGTVFPIPAEMTFARTASFWESQSAGTTWYDNGWNFFDNNWSPKGVVAWDNQNFAGGAAIFSGDPVNGTDFRGRAAQMADLYFDKLVKAGVRYAVWSILCYSRKKFSEAKEVLATLQLGEEAAKGKTYEPSRAQMVFPLKSDDYTSYVAYIDLEKRHLVYMDAGLPTNVNSASNNQEKLSALLPAYVQYLDAVPTVVDLLGDAKRGSIPVQYSDAEVTEPADRSYVFRRENPENTGAVIALTDLVEV